MLFHLDSTNHAPCLCFSWTAQTASIDFLQVLEVQPQPCAHPSRLIGCISFLPARSNGQTKKLTVGILQLSVEVTHYIVPSKEAAAYLQAKVRLTT